MVVGVCRIETRFGVTCRCRMQKLVRYAVIGLIVTGGLLGAASPASAEDPGHALRFDGVSDFVRLAATSAILGTTWPSAKTVSLWVNPTGTATCTAASPSSCDAIFGDRPRTWGISRGTLGGLDRIWVWNYDGTFDTIAVEYTIGAWIQVTLVHGAGTLHAYKNGVLVGSLASGNTQQGSSQAVLHVGGIINNASRNWTFQGEVDEVQVWDIARSEEEIAAGLNVGLTGSEPGLRAYYKMSDGAGTSLTDDSVNDWTGTLHDGGGDVPADGAIQWVESGAFGAVVTVNTPPVADPQALGTLEDAGVPITLTGSDADGDPLTFRVVAGPGRGTLSGTAPDLVYTPLPDIAGTDSFTFVVNDGRIDSPAATVTIDVLAVNDAPVAAPDTATTGVDVPVSIAALANDSDVDGDTLAITAVGGASNGTAAVVEGGISYTPNADFEGTDTFTYEIEDGNGGTAIGQVTVTVRSGADAGFALQFDGTSDMVRLAETSLMLGPAWQTTKTASLWVKPTGTSFCNGPGAGSCDAIFGDRPRWWGISRGVINGLDRIWIWNWDGSYDVIPVEYTNGQWVHIAMVHANGILTAYRNGVPVGSIATGPTIQPSPPAFPILYIGGVINNATRNWTFSGEIDELQLWSTARTQAEIQQDMAGPLGGNEPGLAAYYAMTNGSGSFLNDDSGNGWMGQLLDGAQGVPPDGPIEWVLSGAFQLP